MKINLWSACAVVSLLFFSCNSAPVGAVKNDSAKIETATPITNKKNIIFFGNSLTAAYGLDDVSKGFVGLTQQRIDSLGLPYRCVNAGTSGATTADGKETIGWVVSQQPIDVFILELGGNDALRGIMPDVSIQNLQAIIDSVKAKSPGARIILAGMEAPPQMGKKYTDAFRSMYATLAQKNNLVLIPFILEGVGGVRALNQPDGIHPTAAGNRIVVETIWKYLSEVIR